MSDVAARAGVSHQTVSRVLNNHPSVREETRQRVVEAIQELGYRRNEAARALVTNRTETIGVLTSGSVHFGPAEMIRAIEAELRHKGFYVAFASLDTPDSEAAAEALGQLLAQGVEGVIAVAPTADVATMIDTLFIPCPVVVVASRADVPADSAAAYVSVDQFGGGQQATQHLIDQGKRHLIHLAGPGRWYDAAARRRAFDETVAAAPDTAAEVIEVEEWTAEGGYQAGLALVDRLREGFDDDTCTAQGQSTASQTTAEHTVGVFAANDMIALGAMRAFYESDLRVPEDIAVVGFDDFESSAYLTTPLSSVRQPFQEVGRLAVDHLLARLETPISGGSGADVPADLPRFVAPSLQVRASSGQ